MSYFSDLSLDGDKDNNSLFDNSMYVLPTKTILNSSLYLNTNEKTNSKNSLYDMQYESSRKIGSNIEIPTYRGFSIANSDYKCIQPLPVKQSKLIIDGVKLDDKNIKRKQNIIKDVKGGSRSEEFIKRLQDEKLKCQSIKENNMRSKEVTKTTNPIKHTESFWTDSGLKKPVQITGEKTIGKSKIDPVHDKSKSHNQESIKSYIEKKKHREKQALDSKYQMEKDKELRIKKNLRQLTETRRTQNPARDDLAFNQKTRPTFQPLSLVRQIVENDEEEDEEDKSEYSKKRSSRDDSSTSDSSSRCSLKRQIMNWQPLDKAILEGYENNNRRGIKEAIDNNKHVIKILDNISLMKDKMENNTHAIREFHKHIDHTGNDRKQDLKLISIDLSVSEMESEDFSHSDVHSTNEVIWRKPSEYVKPDVKPSISGDRPRYRKLFDDNRIINDHRQLEIDDDAYGDCVARLLEENMNRYEQCLDNTNNIILPFNKGIVKRPVVPISPYRTEGTLSKLKPHSLHSDPLRFMKVYQKSKQHTKISSQQHNTSKSSGRVSVEAPVDYCAVLKSPAIMDIDDQDQSDSSKTTAVTHSVVATRPCETKKIELDTSDTSDNDEVISEDVYRRHSQGKPRDGGFNPRRSSYSTEARLSPTSLERQFRLELDYYESVEVSTQQLLQTERLQGVALAQHETVSLAQLLKARQWQDDRQEENNDRFDKFTTAMENITKHLSYRSHKGQVSNTTTETDKKSSISRSSEYSSKIRTKSSTETDASEIEEEVVDTMSSSTQAPPKIPVTVVKIPLKPSVKTTADINRQKTSKSKKPSLEDSEIVEIIENGSTDHDSERTDSEDRSIKEIISQRSYDSSSTLTDNRNSSIREISTEKSADIVSGGNRTEENSSKDSDKSLKEVSTASSVATTESVQKSPRKTQKDRSDILKEVTTARSDTIASDVSSSIKDASSSKRTVNSERSEVDYSENTFENSSPKPCEDNNSVDLENSDVVARINALIYEKNKKKDLVKRLSKDMTRIKNIRKENVLKDQIKHLNSQIDYLENEIKHSDGSLSSISSIPPPIHRKKTRIDKKPENILPNHSSISSSSSISLPSINKTSDNKDLLLDVSKDVNDVNDNTEGGNSSSTLVSDQNDQKDYDQKSKGRVEEVDTPRSVKQLQFGDINEEYSASDRESSDLRTPSEKSRLSKEVTDNGATKSKSEKFHFLNLNDNVADDGAISVPGSPKLPQDDAGMMSARTIHSEMSDIEDECVDVSDREIDEIDNCIVNDYEKTDLESEKDAASSYKDLYSDRFTESSDHNHEATKTTSKHATEPIDDSDGEQMEYLSSPDSSESRPPIIPPRRKDKESRSSDHDDNLAERQLILVESISETVLKSFIDDLVQYVDENLKEADQKSDQMSDKSINNDVSFEFEEPLSPDKYTTLIAWNDENIARLADIAVEQMFAARMNRDGSTVVALNQCYQHLPEEFVTKNDTETIKDMIRITTMVRASENTQSQLSNCRYIDKILIYDMVLEIVRSIYAMDDESKPSVWLTDVFNLRRNKMIRLWRGGSEPTSVDLVKRIVREEMVVRGVLSRDRRPMVARSRLHQWFMRQHRDRVDQLLVDETIQDESDWSVYEKLEEDILVHWSDDIVTQLLDDGISDVLAMM